MKTFLNKQTKSRDSKFIIRMFAGYLFIAVVLFIVLTGLFIYPHMRASLDGLQMQSDRASVRTYAGILDRYIEDREHSLSDIAQSPYVLNAVLLAQGERADFRDYLTHSNMLREDPVLTVLDINGDILFSEDAVSADFSWAIAALEAENERIIKLNAAEDKPQFQLAIPIIHGEGREGIIVAKLSADPKLIFKTRNGLNETSGVTFQKDGRVIQSNLSEIIMPHRETQFLDKYGVEISHITSRKAVIDKRRFFVLEFILASIIAAFLAFTLLVLIGRRMLLRPYVELALSKEAISKAVEGISRVDTDGRYIEMNNAYANNAGYVPDELVGKDWVLTVHPDDLDMLNAAYADMIETGSVTAEARGIKKDGSLFYKQVTMISQYDEKNNFIGHHCFMKDISARKASEAQREKLVEKLSDSNEELERFAFVCSHDLQEPLRMIRSFSERLDVHLKDKIKGDKKAQKYLHFVTDGAMRSQELIHDILSYSSVNSDTSNLEHVDLNALVQVIQTTMCAEQKTIPQNISWDKLPSVMGNKTQLYQLLQNLINNGLKYQKANATPKVHVGLTDNGDEWIISVRDNGIGMNEKHLSKIFEVFQRLHRRSEYAGTGIGLSICRKVIERHGGKIWVESEIDHGSTFFFSLPKSGKSTLNAESHNTQTLENTDDDIRKAS